jgi:DNA-binding MarR family transcriptional regulator
MATVRRPLVHRTGFVLAEVGKAAQTRADRALEPLGLTGKSLHVLNLAAGDQLSQQQLVAITGIDRTTMVALVDDLERLGLAVRQRDTSDRRRYVVVPTEEGNAALVNADQIIDAAEQVFLASLDAVEQEQLHTLAARVLQAARDKEH